MIISIGEILCDLIGWKCDSSMKFNVTIGGAPLNVALNLTNLGTDTYFYGVVGNDLFGNFIKSELLKYKSLKRLVKFDNDANTTLAISIKNNSEEDNFQFLRKNGADFKFDKNELYNLLNLSPKIIHFGSLFLSDYECYLLMLEYVKDIKEKNVLCSFDVNYRDDIFNNKHEAKKRYLEFINEMDIVKFSEKEIKYLAGKENLDEAIKYFSFLKVFFITLGSKGSICAYKKQTYFLPSEPSVKVVDSIGAGDSFYSGVLHQLENKDINNLSKDDILNALLLGNRCGAKTVSQVGATGAYKSIEDVME